MVFHTQKSPIENKQEKLVIAHLCLFYVFTLSIAALNPKLNIPLVVF